MLKGSFKIDESLNKVFSFLRSSLTALFETRNFIIFAGSSVLRFNAQPLNWSQLSCPISFHLSKIYWTIIFLCSGFMLSASVNSCTPVVVTWCNTPFWMVFFQVHISNWNVPNAVTPEQSCILTSFHRVLR